MVKLKGIDVSDHNGKINWDKVKADGVQFAILRLGIGSDIKAQDDEQFEYNVREAERVGIPWGAYLYSYALNLEQAKSEAAHAKRLLKGKKPTYPVVFDMEDADGYKKKRGMPSNSMLVDICDTFLAIMEKEGYEVRLYANLSWLNNQLKSSKLDKYTKWVAQWGPKCTYAGKYDMWQYTDAGKVNGINSEKVDMNFAYFDFAAEKVVEAPKTAVKAETTKVSTYDVVKTVNAYVNAADAKAKKNKKGTVAKGVYYVFNKANGMVNVTNKKGVPGSWINPAENKKSAAKSATVKYHIVAKNETVTSIAKKEHTTVAALKKLNPSIKNIDLIFPKQKIRIK